MSSTMNPSESGPTNARNVSAYANVGLRTDIESASPHRLIKLLLDGAVERIHGAINALKHEQIARKGENISVTLSIIAGLRASLDHEGGGEIAANLDGLYEYTSRILIEGNLENDEAKFIEAISLLDEIRTAWGAIASTADAQAAPV